MAAFVTFEDVSKVYHSGEIEIRAVDHISFTIEKGEFCVIVGPSGAGKTTVLNMLGGMDACSGGTITVDGTRVSGFNARQLTTYRRHDIGFVFQFYNLVPDLTIKENIEVTAHLSKNPLNVDDLLRSLGLYEHRNKFPRQVSGGQQQRCSIGRAIVKNPDILLCDEPTGALDYQTGKQVLKVLQDTCKTQNKTVIVITHNLALTPMGDKVIKVRSGKIESITYNEHPMDVNDIEY